MSKLAQEALESCAALKGNLEELHRLVLAACPAEKLGPIEVEFRNVLMNLGQIRHRVPLACVVEERQREFFQKYEPRWMASPGGKMAAANDDTFSDGGR